MNYIPISAHLEVGIPSWANANLYRSPVCWCLDHLSFELPNNIENLLEVP